VKGKEDDSVDLTTIGKMNSETPPKPICKIKLDDNYLVQDPTNNATDLFVTYTPYAYINNIDYGEIDPATKLHKQSTALWYDRNILMNFVKDYYMQK
jgi:phage anti-repressor protein